MDLVVARPEGLYCTAGDFYIDPWKPVARAVITHAHSDHARVGHGHYLAHTHSEGTLRTRLGEITLQTLPYGEVIEHKGVKVSLHPAGHVLAPPSAQGTPWMKRFGNYSDAFASGWMQLRGSRRRRGVDRGFVMSDHADWPGLQQAIKGTGAERVFVTHGSVAIMVRWLIENGLEAQGFKTEYGDEDTVAIADEAKAEA